MEKTEFLPNVQTEEKKENTAPVQSGAVNADMNAAAQQTQMDKFQAAQGHGYAAEQANNLYDILTGKDAKIVGGDNAKDGPDRMVNGVNIQTKYCHDAASSVQAAFAIIDTLRKQGYTFVTVEELLRLNGITPEPGKMYRSGDPGQ